MDCKEYKIKLIELAESGALGAFPTEVQKHCKDCASCVAFAEALKVQYAYIRQEKNEPVNPFLNEKIIYKMSTHSKAGWNRSRLTKRIAIYAATLVIGLITGISASYFFLNDTEQSDVASNSTEQISPLSDDENSVLSLNE
jgi:hypothetical protein